MSPPKIDEIASPKETPSQSSGKKPSLTQRIGASSSGLLHSSFGTPSLGGMSRDLASLSYPESKRASVSGSGDSEDTNEASSLSTYSHSRVVLKGVDILPGDEIFRSGQRRETNRVGVGQTVFNEFVTTSEERPLSLSSTQVVSPTTRKQNSYFIQMDDGSFRVARESDSQTQKASQRLTTAETDARIYQVLARNCKAIDGTSRLFGNHNGKDEDGAAVVALLSDPSFSIKDDTADFRDYNIDKYCVNDKGKTYSYQERHKSTPHHDACTAINPLDLIPDFNAPKEPHFDLTRKKIYQLVVDGLTTPNQAEIQPWIDILDKYQDDVWGDMLPLVRGAREEIRIARPSEKGTLRDRPAIRRLQMLMNHLNLPVG